MTRSEFQQHCTIWQLKITAVTKLNDLQTVVAHFTSLLPCIVINFFLNNQPDALITLVNKILAHERFIVFLT